MRLKYNVQENPLIPKLMNFKMWYSIMHKSQQKLLQGTNERRAVKLKKKKANQRVVWQNIFSFC